MSDWIKSTGTIIYDPSRSYLTTRNSGWCILQVSTELTRYYRWWMEFQFHTQLDLPFGDAHVSIVRGEPVLNTNLWKKYHRQEVEFEYQHGNITTCQSGRVEGHKDYNERMVKGDYYILPVKSPMIDHIREELGLRSFNVYHLTIGRSYDYIARIPKDILKKRIQMLKEATTLTTNIKLDEHDFRPIKTIELAIPVTCLHDYHVKYERDVLIQELGTLVYNALSTANK